MKKFIFSIACVAMTGLFMSCGSTKQTTVGANEQPQRKTFGLQTSIPCFEFDTEEYYTGYGSFYGPYTQVSRNINDANRLARTNLVEKMAHAFNGFVEQSSHSEGNNRGNDVGGAVKTAGLEVIKQEVGRLRAACSTADDVVDANGNVTVHVGLRMYLKDLAQALLASSPKDNLTKEEKLYEQWKHEQSQSQLQKYLEQNKPVSTVPNQ